MSKQRIGHIMVENFENVLDKLDKCDDFKWITRHIEFSETFRQERPKVSSEELKHMVASCKSVVTLINENTSLTSKDYIKKKIHNILNEIGYSYDLTVIRWLGYILVKTIRKSIGGLYVNEEKLFKIKRELGSCPVVFLPTHRSYGDFILMAFVCFNYSISIPCVAAGMDFLSMKFMNRLLRKSKAFFMRRSFTDDIEYRTVFKEYIKALISLQTSPVEFFIEGTRSRTGKSLMPKFGLLTMLVDAFMSGDVPEIKFVPINISYTRILEDRLFSHELMGIPKPKESTAGLIKGLRKMNENCGDVFINFGEPLSIRAFFSGDSDRRFISSEYEYGIIKQVAFKVIEMHQTLQTFTSFNILALILNSSSLRTGSYRTPLKDAVEQFDQLLVLFKAFGATVNTKDNIESSLREAISIHSFLIGLSDDECIYLKTAGEIHSVSVTGCLEHLLKYVPYVNLQIYINPCINIFIRAAIIIIILNRINEQQRTTIGTLFENYKYLCSILKYEFVLEDTNIKEFNNDVTMLVELEILNAQTGYVTLKHTIFNDFLVDIIQPFIAGIRYICLFLHDFQDHMDCGCPQEIHKKAQSFIVSQIMDSSIPYYYCVSIDFISNTINSFLDLEVISKNKNTDKYVIDDRPLNFITEYVDSLTGHVSLDQKALSPPVYKEIKSKL